MNSIKSLYIFLYMIYCYIMKRLVIEIPEKFHKRIKELACMRNITMRTWCIRELFKGVHQQEQYITDKKEKVNQVETKCCDCHSF